MIETVLSWLKVDLGIQVTTAYDERLRKIIATAMQMIEREGIEIEGGHEDLQLITMYSAWLWRKRDDMTGMPRMLRLALNNRLMGQKME